ncbi:hypothetical protein E8E13_003839 [Curvularia kusanoi]|uniref:Uncharacterized protein n=1 Tax=Curvularia kusanoi TaxID=90978 RepID=A0A9P4WBS0_CURKU|nr:hypothetical protein E8E13_003839 [Curvularia kusanoi]
MPSYASSSCKGAYAPKATVKLVTTPSNCAQSAHSSHSYGSRAQPVIVHKPSGPINDTNTSTSAGNSGYYN